MTELSGGVVSLLNKRRRACLGVERQIVGDAVAYYRNWLLKWNTICLAEAYKLSFSFPSSIFASTLVCIIIIIIIIII